MESLRRDKNLLTAISQVCVMRALTPAKWNYRGTDLFDQLLLLNGASFLHKGRYFFRYHICTNTLILYL